MLAFNFTYSQTKDKYGNINIKGLSEADMERIFGDIFRPGRLGKALGDKTWIREVIISGNKITTILYNYGSICKPNTLGNIADLVWEGLGYGFEFGPLAAGQVAVPNPGGGVDSVIIVDDSFVLTTQGSYSPDGTEKWGWLPKAGYLDPSQNDIATLNSPDRTGDGKPDSWPDRWYNPEVGRYLWPAFLGDQATAPDEEVYFVMDDFTNKDYVGPRPYYPFPSDTTKRGLGLDAEVRIIQFNNPLAQDIMFLVYRITNVSEKNLPRLYFGMHGDPHVGGPANYSDDRAYFIPPLGPLADPYPQRARSMVYAFDEDGVGDGGRPCGYFGWKFLESPSQHTDGKDNDDDGITDESPFNSAGNFIDGINIPLTYGISDVIKYTAVYGEPKPRFEGDEDGDWNPARDDIGIDGIGPDSPNYPGPDYGEGDGIPSQGWYLDMNDNDKYDAGEPISDERLPGYKWAGSEPNFGLRDISESDQLGLTSFHAVEYTNSLPNVPKNTSLMWEFLSSEIIDPNQELLQNPGDNVFNFGTGPLSLEQGETQRFSMAILFGWDLDDLVLNAETSTRVLEADYRFAQPPLKPVVKAVPGDGRVTLYWDTRAERSVDPLSGEEDFQGYKIYRSQDFRFSDVYTITDGNGIPFLGQALFDPNTGKRAQFDLVDSLFGYHPVEYEGRAVKYWLGNNTGLVHEYVDSTVKNGITYYYAVVSYDGGNLEPGKELPPTESQAVILQDPITSELKFDDNTVMVTPGGLPAGIANAQAGIGGYAERLEGVTSTGKIRIDVKNHFEVENKEFNIEFIDDVTYDVLDDTGIKETFTSKDTVFVALSQSNILPGSFKLYDSNGNLIDESNYFVNLENGRIRGLSVGNLPFGQTFRAEYKYYPVYQSNYVGGEDANPDFNGVKIYVINDSLTINYDESGFTKNSSINLADTIRFPPTAGNPRVKYRADWEFIWNGVDTTETGTWAEPGDTAITNLGGVRVVLPFKVTNVTENVPGSYLVFVPTGTKDLARWRLGQSIILRPTGATGATTTYQVEFNRPADTSVAVVYPKKGDIYFVKTYKPFEKGDKFKFSTKEAVLDQRTAQDKLADIYVVPNPYVAYSASEQPGRSPTQRGERDLQFRNLPPKCTIRIYTLVGELVQTIEKDDLSSMAHWDLLSNEAQKVAYGVYIYHVDAPGIGEKIGRFAVIK